MSRRGGGRRSRSASALDREVLRSTYSLHHGPKVVLHQRRVDVRSKPSAKRLLAPTNEQAEDLTGQRLPMGNWSSETREAFHYRRDSSRPLTAVKANQSSVFNSDRAVVNISDVYLPNTLVSGSCCSWSSPASTFSTTYGQTHRAFLRDEQRRAAPDVQRSVRSRPWLRDPVTHLKFNRPYFKEASSSEEIFHLSPTEAQLATLPHYSDPNCQLGVSEVQEAFRNPRQAASFYFQKGSEEVVNNVHHLRQTRLF